MKVEKIVLKDIEIQEVEVEDGYEGQTEYLKKYTNIKQYPLYLTNWAIKKGKDEGLIQTSLWNNLIDVINFVNISSNADTLLNENAEIPDFDVNSIDETMMQKIIYLAFIGANNKTENISFDEFLQKFHYDFQETVGLYVSLVSSVIEGTKTNSFADEFKKVTENSFKKK